MKTKITISPEIQAFNDAVETADTLTDFRFDQDSAEVLLQGLRAEKDYPYNAEALAEAMAGIAACKPIKFFCPECGKQMECEEDSIAHDFYVQCRNSRCSFDGAHGETPSEAASNAGCKITKQ